MKVRTVDGQSRVRIIVDDRLRKPMGDQLRTGVRGSCP